MPFQHQGVSYGIKHQRGAPRRDAESQSMIGSRYKGPDSTDQDFPNKFDNSSMTPYTGLEALANAARFAWVSMALWQLCRHSEFSTGIWYGITLGQLCASGLIMLVTGWTVYKNEQERFNNLIIVDGKIQMEADGTYRWKDPAKVHDLPEIRNGFLWTLAVAGADAATFWACYDFWHSNFSSPLGCVDQRRSDNDMWIVIVTQTFASVEAIQYFFNFLVYRIRKHGGIHAQLAYDI